MTGAAAAQPARRRAKPADAPSAASRTRRLAPRGTAYDRALRSRTHLSHPQRTCRTSRSAARSAPVARTSPARAPHRCTRSGEALVGGRSARAASSPVVRKIAREHHVDVRNIAGSGDGGRVTKNDILAYIEAGAPARAPGARRPSAVLAAKPLRPVPAAGAESFRDCRP